MSNERISSNWPGFRRIWGIIAVLLFLLLILMWALGYGPGGKHCEVPATVVEKIVEKEKIVDNPELLTKIGLLENENSEIAGLKARITELESMTPKTVVKEIESPELISKVSKLEAENLQIPMLQNRITELENAKPVAAMANAETKMLENKVRVLEVQNLVIPTLRGRISELEKAKADIEEVKTAETKPLLNKIRTLEVQNLVIPTLRTRIEELESNKPEVDVRALLAQVKRLEDENKLIPELRSKISALENAEPKVVEKIVEKRVEVAVKMPKPSTSKVYFGISSAQIPADTGFKMAGPIAYLLNNPDSSAILSGFHDATGSLALNKILANKRAEAVASVLQNAGVPSEQVIINQPLQSVGSGSLNEARRVEVDIE